MDNYPVHPCANQNAGECVHDSQGSDAKYSRWIGQTIATPFSITKVKLIGRNHLMTFSMSIEVKFQECHGMTLHAHSLALQS